MRKRITAGKSHPKLSFHAAVVTDPQATEKAKYYGPRPHAAADGHDPEKRIRPAEGDHCLLDILPIEEYTFFSNGQFSR
jgi:hypothetical protein